jgi:hypothetical protein
LGAESSVVGPEFDSSFWFTFWPSLFARVIGVLLGLPVALWVTRVGVHLAGQAERIDQAARLRRALQVIDKAIDGNHLQLKALGVMTGGDMVMMTPGFSAAAWDAVKSEVIPYLHDPELQGDLATYFSEVEVVIKLNERYVDSKFGMTATLESSETLGKTLQDHLAVRAGATAKASERLRSRLRKRLA